MRTTLFFLLALAANAASAQDPRFGFTYQGELRSSGQPASGPHDFEFALFTVASGGLPLAVVAADDRAVASGLFTADVNFGVEPFSAAPEYWLEVHVRDGASTGGYTALLPRQKLAPAPRALSSYTVQPGGVDGAAIQSGAVTTAKIETGAVTNDRIAPGTIAGDRLAFTPGDITQVSAGAGLDGGAASGDATLGIANDGITGAMLPAGVVGTDELATRAVTNAKLDDGAVNAAKVDANEVQVRTEKLETGCAGANESIKAVLADGSVACETDDAGASYTPGTGIAIAGATVAIDEAVVPRKDGAASQAFDGTSLVIDYANNRVGVGTSTPGTQLDVNGAIAGASFAHRTTQTGYYYVTGPAFNTNEVNEDDAIGILDESSITLACGATAPCNIELFASVNLPSGVTVDELRCYFRDQFNGADIAGSASFTERAYTATSSTPLASMSIATTFNSPNLQEFADTTVPDGLIEPAVNAYALRVMFATDIPAALHYFYGCRLRYVFTTLTH